MRPAALPALLGALGPALRSSRYVMIANSFTRNQRRPLAGKWADPSYRPGEAGAVYPPFPRGATHVVSRPLAQYVAEHMGELQELQVRQIVSHRPA